MTENGGTRIGIEEQPDERPPDSASSPEYPRLPVTLDVDPERIVLVTLLAVVFALPLAGLWRLAFELAKIGWAWWPGS